LRWDEIKSGELSQDWISGDQKCVLAQDQKLIFSQGWIFGQFSQDRKF
jgi:hypothetical protein